MARSLRSLSQVATLRHGHLARRFAPAFRALGVCEHIWPFSRQDIWATLLSPKWLVTKRPCPLQAILSAVRPQNIPDTMLFAPMSLCWMRECFTCCLWSRLAFGSRMADHLTTIRKKDFDFLLRRLEQN